MCDTRNGTTHLSSAKYLIASSLFYIKGYHIGEYAGIEPVRKISLYENDAYMEVCINDYERKDVYKLLLNKIPKPLLELEVIRWRSAKTYRDNHQHNLEHIYIDVSNNVGLKKVKDAAIKEESQLDGQMTLSIL